ncbi:MAG: dynamin family protein [Pseudomonadota bacterium]
MMMENFHPNLLEHGVGRRLNNARLALLNASDQLTELSGDELTVRVRPVKDRLTKMMTRVAVVGQIKAGKSTFANCVSRRMDLLPADVNPWTSVVTQLYFGHHSGKNSGAVFRFFDEDQWDILANRGGRLAALTEGLLEDYKRTELLTEVRAMRMRAEGRLGEEFDGLLGKSHRFSSVTPEIMERYVSAGDELAAGAVAENEPGRFADITHTAEIFFEQSPFGCPICLIDTPGINDPLLIREEITQQSLEDADYFVVVLSAHQPLSKEDVRLIRLLRALDRNRFVVFVNRVDEISNAGESAEALRNRVAAQMVEYLDGTEVEVVVGSMEWAKYALTGTSEFLDQAVLDSFVDGRGLLAAAERCAHDSGLDLSRAKAYVASGIGEVETSLSRLLLQGGSQTHFLSMADDLKSVSGQLTERLKLRLNPDPKDAEPAEKPLTAGEAERLMNSIITQANNHIQALEIAMQESCDALGDKLADQAETFAEAQRDEVKAAVADVGRDGDISIDLDPLRSRLTKTYKSGFDEIQGVLWDELKSINHSFRSAIPKRVEQPLQTVRIATLPIIGLLPRSNPFNKTVTFDLSQTWLAGIFARSDRLTDRALDTIKTQFTDIALTTVDREKELFSETLAETIQQFEYDLKEQLGAVVEANASAAAEGDTVPPKVRQKAQEDLAKLEKLTNKLSKLQADLEREFSVK